MGIVQWKSKNLPPNNYTVSATVSLTGVTIGNLIVGVSAKRYSASLVHWSDSESHVWNLVDSQYQTAGFEASFAMAVSTIATATDFDVTFQDTSGTYKTTLFGVAEIENFDSVTGIQSDGANSAYVSSYSLDNAVNQNSVSLLAHASKSNFTLAEPEWSIRQSNTSYSKSMKIWTTGISNPSASASLSHAGNDSFATVLVTVPLIAPDQTGTHNRTRQPARLTSRLRARL